MEDNNSQAITKDVKGIFSSGRPPRKRVIRLVGLAALVIVIIALVSGVMAVTFKLPGQRVLVSPQVCNADTVTKYNTAAAGFYGDNPSDATAMLDTLSTDISKRSGNNNDPSCVFIRYKVALTKRDHATAKTTYERYVQLVDQGMSADGRIDGLSSVEQMKRSLAAITPNTEIEFDD